MYVEYYWTLSYIGYQKQKNILIEERTICTLRYQVQFLFLFFSDRRTLKFLKMQCNPTNKKTVA